MGSLVSVLKKRGLPCDFISWVEENDYEDLWSAIISYDNPYGLELIFQILIPKLDRVDVLRYGSQVIRSTLNSKGELIVDSISDKRVLRSLRMIDGFIKGWATDGDLEFATGVAYCSLDDNGCSYEYEATLSVGLVASGRFPRVFSKYKDDLLAGLSIKLETSKNTEG